MKDFGLAIGRNKRSNLCCLLGVEFTTPGAVKVRNFDAPRRPYGSTMDLAVKKKGLHINGRAQHIPPGLKMDGILCLGATAS